jgi:uncharacterized membrane protein
MDGRRLEAIISRVFRYSLILKAVHSAVELIAGVMLHVTSSDSIVRVARALTRHELLEHPNDLVAKAVLRAAESLSIDQKAAATIYLLSHGVVEFFLVVMILRNRIWAYPVYMVALGLLILYQCYQLTLDFWPLLALLTLWDVVVVGLTWHELRVRRSIAGAGQNRGI